MGFIIGLLTVVLVLDCIILGFLILIQLPKKEAGAGLAFGAGATDALFGAGSGTVLTKVTKYAATVFFVLAIVLALLQRIHSSRPTSDFERSLQKASTTATQPPPPPTTAPAASTAPAITPNTATNLLTTPAEATNAAPPAPTNPPAAK